MTSRLVRMRAERKDPEYEPEMPPVRAEHVLGYLFEVGPTLVGTMSEVPLSHIELVAWQADTGVMLTSWETRTLCRLSRDYLAQVQKSQRADCPTPWKPGGAVDLSAVATGLRDSIRGLIQS